MDLNVTGRSPYDVCDACCVPPSEHFCAVRGGLPIVYIVSECKYESTLGASLVTTA
jgi:hypothetical protein